MNSRAISIGKMSINILKKYFVILLIVEIIDIGIDTIVALSTKSIISDISYGNILSVFMVVAAIVIPTTFLNQFTYLGASRKEFYFGSMIIYIQLAVIFAILNTLFYYVIEGVFLLGLKNAISIIDVFQWSKFGVLGVFIYQIFVYLLAMAFINLFFVGIDSKKGIVKAVIISVLIALFTSIQTLRHMLASFLGLLLSNPSLLQGLLLTLVVSIVIFYIGWWLTKRIEIS